jgi:prepilin-type N-terminal cleavage/methylation domain-containing protein
MIYKNSGMTLIEVLASIAILSIILIGFGSVFTLNAKHTGTNDSRLTAQNLAEKEMNEALSKPNLNTEELCTDKPANAPEHTGCQKSEVEIAKHTYATYIFTRNSAPDALPTIIVRTYYNENNYVELYDYYTTNSD